MKILLIIIFVISSSNMIACDDGFVKNNSLQIHEFSPLAGDMTKEQYKSTLLNFQNFFHPMVEEQYDADLQVIVSWGSNTVNAFAERSDRNWMITIFGGLARHKAITVDGLSLVLCHELGHHLGGHPKKTTNRWSSAEGQADYYSTAKCLRRFWQNENNILVMQNKKVPEIVVQECAITFSSQQDQALCQRMNLAGKSVALMIQDLDQDSIEPKFETPDLEITRTMNYLHPFSQCRLDTYFSGSICPVAQNVEFDDEDERIGSCHPKNGDIRGLRPRCWFVPKL